MSVTPAKARGRARALTEAEITAAIALFQGGGGTMKSIAASYGVDARTLKRHFTRRNVGAKPDPTVVENVAQAAAEEARRALMGGSPLEYAKKIYETKESTRKAAVFVERMILKTLSECVQNNIDPAVKMNTIKTLAVAAAGLKNLQNIQFDSLGVGTELDPDSDVLPDLEIRVMGAAEIEEVKSASATMGDELGLPALTAEIPELDDDDNGVVVEGEDDDSESLGNGS